MGGKAFAAAHAPEGYVLNIQPLDQVHYDQLKNLYLSKIRTHLGEAVLVEVLKEAPEKTSYGDIDYLLATDEKVNFIDLANAVGATAVVKSGPSVCSFAARQDGSANGPELAVYTKPDSRRPEPKQLTTSGGGSDATSTSPPCAQIDLEVVPLVAFAWRSFLASYGGVGMILGRIIRDVGCSVHGDGLWLQLPELDEAKKMNLHNIADKSGMIWLSSDPAEVMGFMHMPVDRYELGFDTLQDLYTWLSSCRLLLGGAIVFAKADEAENVEVKYQGKPKLYKNFFREGIHTVPRGGEMYEGMSMTDVRQLLLLEALEKFGKAAEHEKKAGVLRRKIAHGKAEDWLKQAIMTATGKEGKNATEIVRAFRRWVGVTESNHELYVLPAALSDETSELYKLVDSDQNVVLYRAANEAFVAKHWEDIRGLLRQSTK
ncbi:hypothetical protein LTR78_000090 [Recurvomyces mirabilis]|uniref:Uncharacterized protein n=1 Tax=Recurvomyces mirabilis TaxID=574656 RepID=A0AAE1C695_9PEZI|nr:hypothetical protein LTR78_000090 [Recurvomyces mirabilis]KAK5161747.1 hypothetical protein LTS14_000092 [Recurvomyces mirabilis]